jgi:hypothetical protein
MRELRLLDQQWQKLDAARIARDLEDAANVARRRFDEIVVSRNIKTGFDVLSGTGPMAALIEAGDIVTIIEPSHPGESITQQFTALLDAAFETNAAILAVPRRIARTSGSIMALTGGPDDASIRVGLEIAAALKERLIVVAPAGSALPNEFTAEARERGIEVEELSGKPDAPSPLPQSSRSRERLRVITRSLLGDASQLFTMLHGVPLLVIEAEQKAPAGAEGGLKASSA